jgi:enoyl-CoA hydratase
MKEFETLQLSREGAVATVVLDRPEKMNSISDPLRAELEEAFNFLAGVDSIRVVRLHGAGRTFSAGYDLAGGYAPLRTGDGDLPEDDAGDDWLAELGRSDHAVDAEGLRDVADWLLRLRRFEKPVIAQVHGYCLSGALDLISICDIVIAGESARFGHPAARALGVPPLLGMLPFKVGALRAKEILFTGDLIDAATAERWNLINRVVPDADLEAEAKAYCERVALTHREMLALHKQVTNRWVDLQGVQPAVDLTVDLDAASHQSPVLAEFGRIAGAEGVKAALEWRDGPFNAA